MRAARLLLLAATALVSLRAAAAGERALGYMLDISRNKVPTMETLQRIVDVLSRTGYNQFQLYTEHTFAYLSHTNVWQDSSPMTADEIRALDRYCAARGIELVPNQNSFGHLEKWFRRMEYRPLAEVPEGGVKGMLIPRALCATDERSFAFLSGLYDELLPNFTSKLFNVGCDEVWELESDGRGRSCRAVRERGKARVWLDYFKRVARLAEAHGRTVQFWDDMIVRKHPELIPELPANAIALEWGYETGEGGDAANFERDCANLKKCGRRFYVCPGTSGWNAISGRHANMRANVDRAVAAGLKYGAEGFLLTDWGNGGMCQPWLTAVPALVYMKAKADGRELSDAELACEIDRLLGTTCGKALLRYQNLYLKSGDPNPENRNTLYSLLASGERSERLTDDSLASVAAELDAARKDRDLTGAPSWVCDGFATMDLLFEAMFLRAHGEHDRIVREMPPRYRELWLRYNRSGGLDDSVKRNFHPPHVAEVLVSFDTEDFVSPANADGVRELTEVCLAEGVVPHHQVVGEFARKLVEWKRPDVVEALRKSVVGTQTRWHSVHPTLLELSDGADYQAVYRRVREPERECVEILKSVLGVDRIWTSCPPGDSESYVAGRVYADLGILYDLAPTYLPPRGRNVWFAGQSRIAYAFNFEEFLPDQGGTRVWPKDRDALLDEWARHDRFCLYSHPNTVHSPEFWDELNFMRGNNRPWGDWILPRQRTPEEARRFLAVVRGILQAVRADPRFKFVTVPEIAAAEEPRRAIRPEHLDPIRRTWLEKGIGPVHRPASWCVADVFAAVVTFLRGGKEFLPGNAFGFLEMPYSTPAQTDVSREEIVAAARRIDLSGFLPAAVELEGGRRIGPRQFLFAALEFLCTKADVVTCAPGDQLGSYDILEPLVTATHRRSWIRPSSFKDTHATDRLRWQIWTLRYDREGGAE